MGDSEQWGGSGGPFEPEQQEDPRKRQWPPPQQQPLASVADNSPRNAGGLSAMGQPAQDPFGPDQDTTTNPTGDRQPDQPVYENVPKRNLLSSIAGMARPGSILSVLGGVLGGAGVGGKDTGTDTEIHAAQARNAMKQQEYENKIKLLNANAFNKMYGYGRGAPIFSQTEPGGPMTAHPGFGRPDVPNAVIPGAVTKATPSGTPQKMNSDQYMTQVLQNPDAYPPEVAALATQYFKNKSTQRPFAPQIYNPQAPPPIAGQEPQPPPPAQVFDPNKKTLSPLPGAAGPLSRPAAISPTTTNKAQDTETVAASLIKAAAGDPSSISELKDFGGFGSQRAAIAAAALRKDPDFSTKELERVAKTVQNFTTSNQMTSANKQITATGTFLEHTAGAYRLAKDLERTNSPLLNMPLVAVQRQALGDPKVAAFEASLMAPLAEYLRIINSGNVAYQPEREEMQKTLAKYNSTPQYLAALQQMGKIVSERWDNLNSEFKRGTKTHLNKGGKDFLAVFPESLSPKAREAAQMLGVTFTGDPGANQQATPQSAAQSGPTATDAKGNKIQWDGKAWTPVK